MSSHPSHLDEEENSDVDNTDEDDWDHKLEHSRENGVPVQNLCLSGKRPGKKYFLLTD